MPRSGDKPQINIIITLEIRRLIKAIKHAKQFDTDSETVRYLIATHPDALALPSPSPEPPA